MSASLNTTPILSSLRSSSSLSKFTFSFLFGQISNPVYSSYHIPEVRIVTVEPLRAGKECELILKFVNPTQHQTVIKFLPLSFEEEETNSGETEESLVQTSDEQPQSLTDVSFFRVTNISIPYAKF